MFALSWRCGCLAALCARASTVYSCTRRSICGLWPIASVMQRRKVMSKRYIVPCNAFGPTAGRGDTFTLLRELGVNMGSRSRARLRLLGAGLNTLETLKADALARWRIWPSLMLRLIPLTLSSRCSETFLHFKTGKLPFPVSTPKRVQVLVGSPRPLSILTSQPWLHTPFRSALRSRIKVGNPCSGGGQSFYSLQG